MAVTADSNRNNSSNVGITAGYALHFFNDENQGLQVIPHANSPTQSITGSNSGSTINYVYILYYLLNVLKAPVDLSSAGAQASTNNNNKQQ